MKEPGQDSFDLNLLPQYASEIDEIYRLQKTQRAQLERTNRQLKKYAEDFSILYQANQEKDRKLEDLHRQLKIYASDLNSLYKLEKEKISQLKKTNQQLQKYANDLNTLYRSESEKRKQLEDANRQMQRYAEDLNRSMNQLLLANTELSDAHIDTVHRLVLTAEFKDEDTGKHIIRLGRYSEMIAERIGFSEKEQSLIRYAAPMHDIGKVGIPDKILMKPGKLTYEEFEIMKTHTIIGAKILANSDCDMLKVAEAIALNHHEKWMGTGYPRKLSGEAIPLVGRIVGLLDVFDALTSRRPYKEPYPIEVAVDIVKKERGKHFDPELVDMFLDSLPRILAIRKEVGEDSTCDTVGYLRSERDREEEHST